MSNTKKEKFISELNNCIRKPSTFYCGMTTHEYENDSNSTWLETNGNSENLDAISFEEVDLSSDEQNTEHQTGAAAATNPIYTMAQLTHWHMVAH